MENVTDDAIRLHNITSVLDYSQIPGYMEGVLMWKVWPPMLILLGSFGNIATILVMRRFKDENSSQYDILRALAIADMTVLYSGTIFDWIRDVFGVFVPNMHTVLCKVMICVFFASHTVSAWLVTAVTVQRTMAVLWPHRMRVLCTVQRTWVVITVIIIATYVLHIPVLISYDVSENKICMVTENHEHFFYVIWPWINMFIASLLPSVCLFVCDVILSWTLFGSTSASSTVVNTTSNTNAGHSHDARQKIAAKMTGMILILSFTFMLLTLPLTLYIVFINVYANTEEDFARGYIAFSVTSFLWDLNSGVNFFLYCLTGTRFREEFWSMVRCGTKG